MKPGPIVAIGGGEMGRPGYGLETIPIDEAVVALSGKRRPNLLFLPTAGRDDPGYVAVVERYYGERLGCEVKPLWLYREPKTESRNEPPRFLQSLTSEVTASIRYRAEALIDWADIIYVGGGNTVQMLKRWRAFGVDQLLTQAHRDGKVLAGISAGAMCWFRFGLTDCWHHVKPPVGTVCRGLDLTPGMFYPHMNTEPHRKELLKQALQRTGGVGYAADDCTALVIEGDAYRIVRSKPTARFLKTFWLDGTYTEQSVPNSGPLALLGKHG